MKNALKIICVFNLVMLILSCVTMPNLQSQPRVTLSPLFRGSVYNRLAIIVVDNTRKFSRSGALRQVEDEFMRAVIEKGYTLAARSDIERILAEQKLQRSDITEKEIARIGRILNVPAVVIVTINAVSTQKYQPIIAVKGQQYYSTSVSISARLISAESAEVLWISSYTGEVVSERSRETEENALSPIASIVASGLPAR